MSMRVLVCGGRHFAEDRIVHQTLDDLHISENIACLIEGDASGADRIAGYWARMNRVENLKFPANWKRDGKAAGPIRNQRMLTDGRPDLVVAFPGGAGTGDMIRRADKAGVRVVRVT